MLTTLLRALRASVRPAQESVTAVVDVDVVVAVGRRVGVALPSPPFPAPPSVPPPPLLLLPAPPASAPFAAAASPPASPLPPSAAGEEEAWGGWAAACRRPRSRGMQRRGEGDEPPPSDCMGRGEGEALCSRSRSSRYACVAAPACPSTSPYARRPASAAAHRSGASEERRQGEVFVVKPRRRQGSGSLCRVYREAAALQGHRAMRRRRRLRGRLCRGERRQRWLGGTVSAALYVEFLLPVRIQASARKAECGGAIHVRERREAYRKRAHG
jgi:hypothetical protein